MYQSDKGIIIVYEMSLYLKNDYCQSYNLNNKISINPKMIINSSENGMWNIPFKKLSGLRTKMYVNHSAENFIQLKVT